MLALALLPSSLRIRAALRAPASSAVRCCWCSRRREEFPNGQVPPDTTVQEGDIFENADVVTVSAAGRPPTLRTESRARSALDVEPEDVGTGLGTQEGEVASTRKANRHVHS